MGIGRGQLEELAEPIATATATSMLLPELEEEPVLELDEDLGVCRQRGQLGQERERDSSRPDQQG